MDYSDSIAIVFPADWPNESSNLKVNKPSEPHCTLIWLGNIPDVSYTKEDVQNLLDRMSIKAPGEVPTTGVELFGPEGDVLVVTLDSERLEPIRDAIEEGLKKIGGKNASQYKDYKPHVTIDEEATLSKEEAEIELDIADTVTLGAPVVWWGDER